MMVKMYGSFKNLCFKDNYMLMFECGGKKLITVSFIIFRVICGT